MFGVFVHFLPFNTCICSKCRLCTVLCAHRLKEEYIEERKKEKEAKAQMKESGQNDKPAEENQSALTLAVAETEASDANEVNTGAFGVSPKCVSVTRNAKSP